MRVVQVIDSLAAGGAERVAVNIANALARRGFESYLCVTRTDGPLAELVAPEVRIIRLARKGRFHPYPFRSFRAFIKCSNIHIVHAHSSSVVFAAISKLLLPKIKLIWHIHSGTYHSDGGSRWPYFLFSRSVDFAFCVSNPLVHWARTKLLISESNICFMPNFMPETRHRPNTDILPGEEPRRIICVANFRRQKDHPTLVHAMSKVVSRHPSAHLLLVGSDLNGEIHRSVNEDISRYGLEANVSILGPRNDVPSILLQCSIGVLSSRSEGFPLALVEYGMAGLPAVATRVGQCVEILRNGECGILVDPGNPDELADALIRLLSSESERRLFGEALRQHVQKNYSETAVMDQICKVYNGLVYQTH